LDRIRRVVSKVDFGSGGNRPPIRLEVYGLQDDEKVEFDINLKVFSITDVMQIKQKLGVI